MKELGIDIETYSSNDLPSCGVYRYVEAPDFTILLFAYSIDNAPAVCCDFAMGEELPAEIIAALRDPAVVKTAFNAAFERICISHYFGWPLMEPAQWKCTMVRAARMGLPLSLGQCGEVLRLTEGKMKEGAALIRYFSVPNRGKRHLPADAPDKWEVFKQYCGQQPDFTPPLHLVGSPFRQAVWTLLLQIPYGQTTTYSALARQLAAQTGAARVSAQAVGGAVGHNAVSLIIPCHRVVGTNGSLTGYAGGLDRKIKLLELEKADMRQLFVPCQEHRLIKL